MVAVGTRLGPYEVLASIGAGGMGEVYRARDTRLSRDVALKLLPEAVARDPERIARFEREAKALAALSHPNLLAIHDVGREGDFAFAVTELLDGETLRERIARERLPWRKAVEIAAAIADGLACAHAHGIVHRDVKPENVFLTADGRVKVLDFGLARLEAATSGSDSDLPTPTSPFPATRAGAVVGTVGYMSPEQVKGQPADHRADLFALGLALHEMLTGKRAFARETAAETMTAILREPAPELHITGSDAPPYLARFVSRCLEKAPGERFQSASDLAFNLRAVLTHDSPGSGFLAPPRKRRRWTRLVAGGLVLLAVAVAGALFWRYRHALPSAVAPTPVAATPATDTCTVSVAPFENLTGDPSIAPVGRLIADAITDGLAKMGRVSVVATEPDGSVPTGAMLALSGAYYSDGGTLRVQARLDDVVAGRLVYAFDPVNGPRERPGELLEPLRQRVMGLVAYRRDGFDGTRRHPPTFAAYQEYQRGMEVFAQDYAAMVQHLEAAIALDPYFSEARTFLFYAWMNQGRPEKAAEVVAAQEDHASGLTPLERRGLAKMRALLAGRLEEALQATRQSLEIAPDNIEDRYVAGLLELALNRPGAAVRSLEATTEGWARTGLPIASWPMLVRCTGHHMLGEYDRELELARQCTSRLPDDLACRSRAVSALAALGRTDDVDRALDEAGAVPARAASLGDVLNAAARELRAHGRRDASLAVAAREVEWRRGALERADATLQSEMGLAVALLYAEDLASAQELLARLRRQEPGSPKLLGQMGVIAAMRGRRDEAERFLAELGRLRLRYSLGERDYWRAAIAAWLGRKSEATRLLQQAFSEGYDQSEVRCALPLEPLRSYPPFEELTRPKG